MSESEVENDEITVNARDSLDYLNNHLYLFHENGLVSIPNRLDVLRKSKPECVRSVSRFSQSLFTEFMVSGETMVDKNCPNCLPSLKCLFLSSENLQAVSS